MALNNFDLLSQNDESQLKAEQERQSRLNGAFSTASSALGLAGSVVGIILPRIGNIIKTAGQGVSLGGSLASSIDSNVRSFKTPHLPSLSKRLNSN